MLRRRSSAGSMLQFARRGVHQAFHQVVRLRPPGAAIGIHRHGVGEHAEHVGIDRLEAVDAGEHAGAGEGGNERREIRKIRAHVGNVARAQRQELAVGVERHLAQRDVVAALRVGQERLAAFGRPFHRPPQLARRVTSQHVFGIEEQLHAEAAADIGGDDAEFVRLGVEHRRHQVLHQPAALRVGVQCPAPGRRVVLRHRDARLHRRHDDTVVHHRQPGDVRGLANCASVAALSPISQSKARLCGTSGQTSGMPVSSAFAVSLTDGRIS